MTQKVDDYYSNISSSDGSSSSASPKKPVIKKKLKLKAKKVEPIKKQEVSKKEGGDTSETLTNTEVPKTLNEALEKEKKAGFTVISRAEWKKTHTERNYTQNFQEKGGEKKQEENQDFYKKQAPKFKPGFSKNAQKSSYSLKEEKDSERGWRKWKLFAVWKSRKHKNRFEQEDSGFVRSNKIKQKKKEEKKIEDIEQNLTAKTGETVIVSDFLSLKEFSEKIGIPLPKLIAEFMKNGMMMTINSQIDFDTASLIAESFEITLEKEASLWVAVDDLVSWNIKDFLTEDDASKLEDRPPVISIMGHVDHGKTSLLDYIRKSKVASGEVGGITQSIGAYQVEYNDKKITFLDTPGHEAFTIMRSRGAKSTDIAILVVAADEGVKPQTIESISHAKEAGIPVIVAINKMDKEGANPDHVKWQLAEHGLTPEDWGGETPMVPVSAHTGFGIDDLLEIILLSAEILELKANPHRRGVATILESHLDMQLGPVATVLVNTGTIEKWSAIVCGASYGKVKVLKDYNSKWVKFATPSMPALLVGLDTVVQGGDILQVVSWIDIARKKSIEFGEFLSNQKKLKSSQLDILMSKIKSGNLKHLKIVLKADTNGSLEAVKNALLKLSTDETAVSIIHSGVGNITQGDVLMCGGSSAILIGFWVSVWVNARLALSDSWVEFIESKIIYHITERIEKIVTGMLDPKEVEVKLCEAKVGAIFYTSKKFLILGLILSQEDSSIENKALVRVIRGDKVIWKWMIDSLKSWVEEVHKIEWPAECGIKLKWTVNVEENDILEIYKVVIEK